MMSLEKFHMEEGGKKEDNVAEEEKKETVENITEDKNIDSIKEKLELFDFNGIYSASEKIPKWEEEKDNISFDEFNKKHTEKWNEWQISRDYGVDIATMLNYVKRKNRKEYYF